MRKTVIAVLTAVPFLGISAYAFAQAPSTSDSDLFAKATSAKLAAGEKVEPLSITGKKLILDNSSMENGERGEAGEGMSDGE